MYTVNKTRSRKRILLYTFIILSIFIIVINFVAWLIIKRNDTSTTSFENVGGNVIAVVKPATIKFTTDKFEIVMPDGWIREQEAGQEASKTLYEFKSEVEGYENRWLQVYVDKIPDSYPLSRILEVNFTENGLSAGALSADCQSFQGAPKPGTQASNQAWAANWQGIDFICNMSGTNHIGAANSEYGYSLPITGVSNATHNYFFLYIDHNVRPDYSILSSAIKSFVAL